MKTKACGILLVSLVWVCGTGCGPSAPKTPLHKAAQEGNYAAVRAHIAVRTDLNAPDKSGWTPLHLAAMKGDLTMVRLLVAAGADASSAGPGNRTPADIAREKGHPQIAQFLKTNIVAGAEGEPTEKSGRRLIDGGLGVSETLDLQ